MDYFCFIHSVISYIENRLKSGIEDKEIESVTGFSSPHVREVFKKCTTISLSRYILYRKISNAAFELANMDFSLTDIAMNYGFDTYDTFTRAFKRFTGLTPSEFRKKGIGVGRSRLVGGVYGPAVIKMNEISHIPSVKEDNLMKDIEKAIDSCVLFGVPKVQYTHYECTPFPSVLKACLNYLGQDVHYSYLMAATGASFRLRWNTEFWDGGNVDIMYIYKNPFEAFERAFRGVGRSYKIIMREASVKKEDFINFVKTELDEGRPVIALGIIGPPEACIVTGYRDHGNTLLGWNFFQENPEFAKDVQIDETGYFICNSWWENKNTIALMSIGEEKQQEESIKNIVGNGIDILQKEAVGKIAGGQAAFQAWKRFMSDEKQFPKDAVLPMLFERLMCQIDAVTMIGEGRSYAAGIMEWIATNFEATKSSAIDAANYFKAEAELAMKMIELTGGFQQGEEQARKLAEPEVRKKIVDLIEQISELEKKALVKVKEVYEKL